MPLTTDLKNVDPSRIADLIDFFSGGGALLCDENWRIVHATPGAIGIFAWTLEELRTMSPGDLLLPADRHRLEAHFFLYTNSGRPMPPLRFQVAAKGGSIRSVDMAVRVLDDLHWEPIRYAVRVRDTSEHDELQARLEAARQQIEGVASTDLVTGLANYPHFELRLMSAWRRASRSNLPVSVILLSVHGLREVNQRHGQAVGDHALRAVASALQTVSRRTLDASGRLGHQLLAALLPDTTEEQVDMLRETLKGRVDQALATAVGGDLLSVSMSSATCMPEPGSDDFGCPLDLAKQAMNSVAGYRDSE